MVNQSLRNRDKVKDDAIVCSMHVIKWWCYNEGIMLIVHLLQITTEIGWK
jgi:hypothetical protein